MSAAAGFERQSKKKKKAPQRLMPKRGAEIAWWPRTESNRRHGDFQGTVEVGLFLTKSATCGACHLSKPQLTCNSLKLSDDTGRVVHPRPIKRRLELRHQLP